MVTMELLTSLFGGRYFCGVMPEKLHLGTVEMRTFLEFQGYIVFFSFIALEQRKWAIHSKVVAASQHTNTKYV